MAKHASTSQGIGYTCKYTPLELFAAFDSDVTMIDGDEPDFELAESLTHANVCSHAKSLLQQAQNFDEIVLTDCCDSIRRVYDVLDMDEEKSFVHLLDLPHENGECSIERYANNLIDLGKCYESYSGKSFSRARFLEACRSYENDIHDLAHMQTPFIALCGARVSPELLQSMEDIIDLPIVNLTCSGNRNLGAVPDYLEDANLKDLMTWYAQTLLTMPPCMRMTDVASRKNLTEHPYLVGIVYNTVKFCDFYGFDYETLRTSTDVPIVKIETDYTPTPQGQLITRLEALMESLNSNGVISDNTTVNPALDANARSVQAYTNSANEQSALTPGAYVAGIDSGSTSTNMVVLDGEGQVVAHAIVRTGAKAQIGAEAAFNAVKEQLNATDDKFAAIVATGYGRFNIPFATDSKTEITCHGRGAHALNPEIHTIIDIGGQDSKVICLAEDGSVANFIMNDKCAAGTGRFLEAMARTLEVDLEELSKAGLVWDKDITISSMCTVFAESEVISLIADNHQESDIVHGINKSIASKTASMVSRAKGKAPFMMTGGVARNRGVVEELERKLDADLFIAENPDLCGALGAALFALDTVR